MSDFKAGDRVIVSTGNDCDERDEPYIDEIGTIVVNNQDGYCEVRLDNHGNNTFLFGEYQLEKTER